MRNILIGCARINLGKDMSSNNRIVSVVDDDVSTVTFFHEALRQNIDGVSVFSFIDPITAFEHFYREQRDLCFSYF